MSPRVGVLSGVLAFWSLGLVTALVMPGEPEGAYEPPTIASVIGAMEAAEVERGLSRGASRIRTCKQLAGQDRVRARLHIDAEGTVAAEVDDASGCLGEALENLPLPEPRSGSAIIELDL